MYGGCHGGTGQPLCKVKRNTRKAILPAGFPQRLGIYNLILVDPPWRYDHSASKTRSIEKNYPTMRLQDILALPVDLLAADEAVVYLWTTAPKLIEGVMAMEAWGFTYKTQLVWDKVAMGMGYWTRGQHEILLVGTMGKMRPPEPRNRFRSIFTEKRRKHSQKPDLLYEMLEAMHPNARKVELFARHRREGWDAWGNEV